MTNTDVLISLIEQCRETSTHCHIYVAKARQMGMTHLTRRFALKYGGLLLSREDGGVDYRDRLESGRTVTSGPGGSNPSPPASGSEEWCSEFIASRIDDRIMETILPLIRR